MTNSTAVCHQLAFVAIFRVKLVHFAATTLSAVWRHVFFVVYVT
jgi:hypothetical protein